ncbi:MAG: TonB-dependent receptor, partial [Flavitalea sp.]
MHKRNRYITTLIAAIISCGYQHVVAQESTTGSDKKDSIFIRTLDEIIVEYKTQLTSNDITPSQTLRGQRLQNMNSLSVADAVRFFSGTQLKDYGGIGGLKTLDTRSMGTNHTAVFYDGIQIGNAQNGQVDLGKFSLDNLQEISLYNSQRSQIFQSARSFASSASLYLQSRVPVFKKSKNYNARISYKGGSFGLIDPSLLYEQKISDKTAITLSSEYIKANGRYKFRYTNGVYDTSATRENADIEAWRIETGLFTSFKDSSSLQLKLYHYRSARGLPGAIVSNKFVRGQRQWDNNAFAQLMFRSPGNKKFQYELQGKFAYDHLRYFDPEYITTTGALDNRYYQREIYLSSANLYRIRSWWEVSASVDLQWNELDANLYRFAYPTRYTALGSLATQLQLSSVNIQGGVLQTLVWDKVQEYGDAGNKQKLTPFIAASWKPFRDKDLRVRAFYKNIFRLPTFNDLYYTFIGNTNLRPEYTTQYNLGLSYSHQFNGALQFVAFDADAYHNDITDKIVAVPTTNLYRWMMLNLGKVNVKGIDLSLRSSLRAAGKLVISPSLKYTYQEAKDVTPGESSYGHQIPYVPKHSGSAIVNLTWQKL